MIRYIRYLAAALAVLGAAPAFPAAVALIITKSSQVVSDPTGQLLPKAVPGAEVDYTVVIRNPNGLGDPSVTGVTFTDVIPANTKLRVTNYALLNPGPVSFSTPLLSLTYVFTNFSDDSDSLSFSADNGLHWDYRPVADSDGCDANVNKIKVVAGGSQLINSSTTIKFRVRVK